MCKICRNTHKIPLAKVFFLCYNGFTDCKVLELCIFLKPIQKGFSFLGSVSLAFCQNKATKSGKI